MIVKAMRMGAVSVETCATLFMTFVELRPQGTGL